jgi:hypothetical protein
MLILWLPLVAALLAPITLTVNPPHYAFAPATLRIAVRIQPVDTDRRVIVILDGEAFYRSSEWEIEGADAPKAYQPWLVEGLPDGEYHISATVGSLRQIRAVAETNVTVQ